MTLALTLNEAVPENPAVARKGVAILGFQCSCQASEPRAPRRVRSGPWMARRTLPSTPRSGRSRLVAQRPNSCRSKSGRISCLHIHLEPKASSPVECHRLRPRARRPGLKPPPARQGTTPHTDAIDGRVVVSPAEARRLLSAVRENTPALHAFFACLYFAGLRPSEAANLRRINLKIPTAGWGEIVLLSSYQPTRSEWTDDGRAGEERSLKHRTAKSDSERSRSRGTSRRTTPASVDLWGRSRGPAVRDPDRAGDVRWPGPSSGQSRLP